MAALEKALLLTVVWPKLDPSSFGNGGSKGHEAEPNFTPKIFRWKVQNYFKFRAGLGLMRVRVSQQTAKLCSLCLCLRQNESPFEEHKIQFSGSIRNGIQPSTSLFTVYTHKPSSVHMQRSEVSHDP